MNLKEKLGSLFYFVFHFFFSHINDEDGGILAMFYCHQVPTTQIPPTVVNFAGHLEKLLWDYCANPAVVAYCCCCCCEPELWLEVTFHAGVAWKMMTAEMGLLTSLDKAFLSWLPPGWITSIDWPLGVQLLFPRPFGACVKSNQTYTFIICFCLFFFEWGDFNGWCAVQFSNQSIFQEKEGNTDKIWNNAERAASSLLIIIC